MSDTTYCGWTNYASWCVHLWLTNEESSNLYWTEQARECVEEEQDGYPHNRNGRATAVLAQRLRDEITDAMPDVSGLYADLLNAALSEVNWREIARAFIGSAAEVS